MRRGACRRRCRKAHSIEEVLKSSDFVTLHVPLLDATRNLINAEAHQADEARRDAAQFFARRHRGQRRGARCAERKAAQVLRLRFPGADASRATRRWWRCRISGASTREAEDNCAIMVVDQVRDFLENGNILNAVNFPDVVMPRESPFRVGIANANVPNMVGQISTAVAQAGLNIHNMLNKSRGEMAYTLVDVDSAVPAEVIEPSRQDRRRACGALSAAGSR